MRHNSPKYNELMKHLLVILLAFFLLSGCARNPGNATLVLPVSDTPTALPVNATIMSTLDLTMLLDEFPASMKGYELVSWQEDGVWWYTLLTGTNRQKSFKELVSPQSWVIPNEFIKLTTNSLADLESILERLPSGSEVIWGGMELTGEVEEAVTYFTYPPADIQSKIASLCEDAQIRLVTLADQE
jgi:hypothetical protein